MEGRPAPLAGQSFLYVVAVASDPTSVRVDAYSNRLKMVTPELAPNEPVLIDWAAAEPTKSAREVDERIVGFCKGVKFQRVDGRNSNK
jgi:hypothetical protein